MKYSFIEYTDFVHRNHRRMWLIQQKAFKKAFKMPFFCLRTFTPTKHENN